jgi:uncharacterized protein
MILLDVNVLVYAHREDASNHREYRQWLENLLQSGKTFGVPAAVFSGFLRVVTHPKIFNPPTPMANAWEFVDLLRQQPQFIPVLPGPGHSEIFKGLCLAADVKGNLVTDAFFAAMAIEQGAEWITSDRDYARFSKLKWRHPLTPEAKG